MSLHDIAKHVQSQGRGQDTVLVHMTPNEVGGLQALAKAHGGSLTRNPQTGLYEAGFLSSVLPMVAGVAAAAFAPEFLPLIAGGIGVADYAMTGSISQGLMAGLGAWSAGSLASGLSAAGESAIATAGGIASLAGGGNTQVAVPAESTAANQNAIKALQTMMANSANAPAQTQAQPAATTGYGAPSFTRTPVGTAGQAIDATQMQGSPAYVKAQADAAAAANQDPFGSDAGFQAWQRQQYLNSQNSGGGGGAAGGLPKDFAYAGGGILAFAQGGQKPAGNKDMAAIDDYAAQAQSGGIASVKDAAQNGDWNAMIALQKLGYQQGKDFAVGGGISDLGSYSDGGRLLKGPGDGVSDSIPAQIGAHQPARLADGEFVIPARIVSELGNGSTDAGAKRLYAMMQRVQAKRKKSMGKGKFAINSKSEKDLPA